VLDRLEELGVSPLLNKLKEFGGWPVVVSEQFKPKFKPSFPTLF